VIIRNVKSPVGSGLGQQLIVHTLRVVLTLTYLPTDFQSFSSNFPVVFQ